MSKSRNDVLKIFHAALAATHGAVCVRRFLATRVFAGPVYVVAIGKAASAMLEGAQAMGMDIRGGLLITKHGHLSPSAAGFARIEQLEAAHPVPDERSLRAGEALLRFLANTPPSAHLLFLISGGASSLVEVLPPTMDVNDLRRLNEWLHASGWDIGRMNALRKNVSLIKGGRLATYLDSRATLQLLMSDVPGDAPADVGSGLLVPAAAMAASTADLPAWLGDLLRHAPPLPAANAPVFAKIETHVVATLNHALDAAADAASQMGYDVHRHRERLSGDAMTQGERVAQTLLHAPTGIHLWGGETTVKLPPQPGRGGRNQQLALAAAVTLAGNDHVCLLAAGTDGSDGPGEDAGALVDGGTLSRGALNGLDAMDCLQRADAGRFLEASGDLVTTGPTGTNVMDLLIALKGESAAA